MTSLPHDPPAVNGGAANPDSLLARYCEQNGLNVDAVRQQLDAHRRQEQLRLAASAAAPPREARRPPPRPREARGPELRQLVQGVVQAEVEKLIPVVVATVKESLRHGR